MERGMSPTWKEGACNVFRDREDGQLPYTSREGGWSSPIFSKVRMMSDSHVLKGKDDDQPPSIKREGGKSLTKIN